MELEKKEYQISAKTIEMVLSALGNNWFIDLGDGEEDNNDEIIEADKTLRTEVETQNV